jgi:hypothetical protein
VERVCRRDGRARGRPSGCRARTINGGAVDVEGLAQGSPTEIVSNPSGTYLLYRVGDAVSSRNVHAAIYDPLRLCKGL